MKIFIAETAYGDDYVFAYASTDLSRLLSFLQKEKGLKFTEYNVGDKIGEWGRSTIHQWLSMHYIWRITECQSV